MENTTNKQDEKGHDANIVLAVSGQLETIRAAAKKYSEGIAINYEDQIISQGQLQLYARKDFLAGATWAISQAACASGAVDKTVSEGEICEKCGVVRYACWCNK